MLGYAPRATPHLFNRSGQQVVRGYGVYLGSRLPLRPMPEAGWLGRRPRCLGSRSSGPGPRV